jgi:hypothetical protein
VQVGVELAPRIAPRETLAPRRRDAAVEAARRLGASLSAMSKRGACSRRPARQSHGPAVTPPTRPRDDSAFFENRDLPMRLVDIALGRAPYDDLAREVKVAHPPEHAGAGQDCPPVVRPETVHLRMPRGSG